MYRKFMALEPRDQEVGGGAGSTASMAACFHIVLVCRRSTFGQSTASLQARQEEAVEGRPQ